MQGNIKRVRVGSAVLCDQAFKFFYDLGHGRAVLMVLGPHTLHELNDFRTPATLETSYRRPTDRK